MYINGATREGSNLMVPETIPLAISVKVMMWSFRSVRSGASFCQSTLDPL